jgi:phosphatidylglycerol:prolipoprotein diacylglycerol transferase
MMNETTHYVHNLSPFAVNAGGVVLPWYWLVYFGGFFFLYYAGRKTIRNNQLEITEKQWHIIMSLGFWAMLFGGRFFYIAAYNPSYYLSNPMEVFAIWKGGMSFHGALISSGIFLFTMAKKFKIPFLRLTDIFSLYIPFVLFFGRLANFMNGELAGRASDVPWAIIFPRYGDNLARHPSQIYQALTEGLLLFIILYSLRSRIKITGLHTGLFVALYGLFRFGTEFFREPDKQLGFLSFGLTMGQWLCVGMILVGAIILSKIKKDDSYPYSYKN